MKDIRCSIMTLMHYYKFYLEKTVICAMIKLRKNGAEKSPHFFCTNNYVTPLILNPEI